MCNIMKSSKVQLSIEYLLKTKWIIIDNKKISAPIREMDEQSYL